MAYSVNESEILIDLGYISLELDTNANISEIIPHRTGDESRELSKHNH